MCICDRPRHGRALRAQKFYYFLYLILTNEIFVTNILYSTFAQVLPHQNLALYGSKYWKNQVQFANLYSLHRTQDKVDECRYLSMEVQYSHILLLKLLTVL